MHICSQRNIHIVVRHFIFSPKAWDAYTQTYVVKIENQYKMEMRHTANTPWALLSHGQDALLLSQ